MTKKCSAGVICIENTTLIFIIMLSGIVLYIYIHSQQDKNQNRHSIKNILYTNPTGKDDTYSNPYRPPLKKIPINIETQSTQSSYNQVGLLTRLTGGDLILPLMGRQLISHRDKWNFYTMSDQNNSVKLPISFNGRSCTNEYGCDNLYNGDSVYVEGYNDAFKVTMYETQKLRYLPSL